MAGIKSRGGKAELSPLEKKLKEYIWISHLARGVMIFGFVASALGNVLHAQKDVVGIIIALMPPTILFLAFELVSRAPMQSQYKWFHPKRWGRPIATTFISGIMAALSYFHQRDAIFDHTGGDQLAAFLLPASIDALMIVGSITLLELKDAILAKEAQIAGTVLKLPKSEPKAPDAKASGKARVAQMYAMFPGISAKELAAKANVSVNYVYTVLGELRPKPVAEPELAIA
jgi:Mor family transcriptional regulator